MPVDPISIGASVLSVLSLVLSFVAYRTSTKIAKDRTQIAQSQSLTAQAQVELYMSERIASTRDKVHQYSLEVAEYAAIPEVLRSEKEKILLDVRQKAFDSSVESNLNAYDEACKKYYDGKVDQARFVKSYDREIRQLVEHPDFKDHYFGTTSPYRAIQRFYEDRNNLEK